MAFTETAISTEQMRLVLEVSRMLALTRDLDALLTEICNAATSLLTAERASIFLHDPQRSELWTRVALGTREIRVPDSAGIVGHVFHSNALLRVDRPYDDPRFNREVDRKTGFVTRNLLTVPTRDMDRTPIGVLQVVNRIGGDFTESDDAMIEMLADQAGVAIQRHYLHAEVVKSAGLRHEMELAQKVQVAMIPVDPPNVPGLKAVGWSRPASIAGGDTYDLWQTSDGRMGIFLGDASGHGIAPAIVVSQARTLLRALCEINADPHWLLDRVNARLALDLEPGRFVTVFAGCISPGGVLRWASAAHGPILLKTGPHAAFEQLEPTAPPIGIMPDLLGDPTRSVVLEPGGMLVVMSDGIFEAHNPQGELYDVQRVVDLLEAHADDTPEHMLHELRSAVAEWQGKEEPADDQTVLIVRRD